MKTNPADGAIGVARDVVIKVTFNSNAQPYSINKETFLVKDCQGNPVSGSVTYANKVASFTPATELALSSRYTVTLTKGIKDSRSSAMVKAYSFDFTTRDGAWETAQLIETYTGSAWNPQIAVDASGNAIVVWSEEYDGIWSNRYTPNRGWGTAELIHTDIAVGAWDPQIAFNGAGNAIAVWVQDGIWSNCYTPSGGWGTSQMIQTGDGAVFTPQIAVDAAGNAIAVWQQVDSTGSPSNIWSNRYTPSGGWGTSQLINAGAGYSQCPQIAIDAAGNAVAVWEQSNGTGYNIWSNRYSPDGGWGTAELIQKDAGGAGPPQIAVDATGNAVAVWQQSNSTSYLVNIWSNRYTPDGGWGTAQLIETDGTKGACSPQIAANAVGDVFVLWTQSDGIWSNRYTPDGGWATAQLIAGGAEGPQVVVDATGKAIAVWEQFDSTQLSIFSSRYTPDGGWATAQLIETDDAGYTWGPQIAIDAVGNAIAVWFEFNGFRYDIWSNRFD